MDYSGMTLNERLYLSGKLEEFEHALSRKDKEKVLSILKMVEVREESIPFMMNEWGFEGYDDTEHSK